MTIKTTRKFLSLPGMTKSIILTLCLFLIVNSTLAQEDEFLDFSIEELGQIRVTNIASGTDTPIDKAAAIVSVISEDDIAAIGARDLSEVLETVPGLHVSSHPIVYMPKFNIRGITAAFGAQTLVMINGIPISSLYLGGVDTVWGGMPVKAIKKIEVIRGPGSALYGADAFAGVVNITTKAGKDIPSPKVGLSHGTYDSSGGWINYGSKLGSLDFGLTLEFNETDGFKSAVEADSQTFFDSITGTNASLAPGDTDTGKQMMDVRAELSGEGWIARVGYQGRDHLEPALGIAESLSPTTEYSSERANFDFTYEFNDIDGLNVTSRFSYLYRDQQNERNNILFPAGTNAFYPLGSFPSEPLFPDGIIGNPEYREEQARANIDTEYTLLDDHILRFGLGYFWGDIYETKEQKNFFADLTPRPGGLEEVADTSEVYLPETDRTNYSIYLQDEWFFAKNWALTTGLRYDDYSDFGDTLNPRLALVWATTDSITTKLLYGKAFRAPVFNELFITSNPVNLGDPSLKPERIDSYELAVSHQPTEHFLYSINTYYYEIEDIITLVDLAGPGGPRQWQNASDRKGYGVEIEGKTKINSSLSATANYSYQIATDKDSNDDVGEAPNSQLYARMNWQRHSMNISMQVNRVGSQQRAPNDSRTSSLGHYTTVDLRVKRTNVLPNLDVALIIKNLGDEDVFEPSLSPGINIPNDHPMAGRTFYGELEYTF